MALLSTRLICRNLLGCYGSSSRTYVKKVLPDALEIATGLEKAELLAIKAGNDDPFKMKALKRKASSRNDPNLVPSYFDSRIVGCICEEESTHVNWMWLHKGEPRRCECGHWFKLVEYKPF